MRHLWFLVLDKHALRAARRALRRGPAHVLTCAITDDAAARLRRRPIDEGNLRILPISIAVEDETGRNIRARVEELTAAVASRAAESCAQREWLPAAQRAWRTEWLRIASAHHGEEGRPLIEFLVFVEHCYGTGKVSPADEIVVDFGRHTAARFVKEHARSLLRLPSPAALDGKAPHPIGGVLLQMGKLSYRLSRTLLRRALRGPARHVKPETNIPAGEHGIILIQYATGMIERFPLDATQDWIEYSAIPHGRIVYYFNRADSPLSDEVRKALSRSGFGWADYYTVDRYVRDPDKVFFGCLGQLLSALTFVRSRTGLTNWMLFARILPQTEYHREFLRAHRVLSLHQHFEFTTGQMALVLACRQEQVAFVWEFWSALIFMAAWYQHAFVDLFLAWGGYDLGHCNALSFEYRYAAQCGVLGMDGREPQDEKRANELRARLGGRPRFVVAMFDSSHAVRSMHQSTEGCVLFYRTVLALVRERPDWGCLIKSKGTCYDELPVDSGIQAMVAELEAQGRCLRLPHVIKPTLAALAGDAVTCFSVNSAGIQAAIGSGRPTLHFDPNNLLMHPLSVAGADGKIIFRDVETFSSALRAVAAGDRSVGDLAPWAHLFDPFGDGLGRKRSGEVMRDYVAARDRGLTRDDALRTAVEAHAIRYGRDLATTRFASHETPGDRLWQNVRRLHYPDWPPDMPFSEGSRVRPIAVSDEVAA